MNETLGPRNIGSWDELKEAFVDRFAGNCQSEVHMATLMHIKQGEDESLGDYIERFKKGATPIKDLRM